jgi:hypothetical protein
MTYTAKAAVYSEILTKTQLKASTMSNFWVLQQVVYKETARL